MTGSGKMIRPAPAEIEFKNMRFLITEQPQDASIQNYIRILRDHRVTHLVCATDPTYKTEDIEHEGVRFTSIPFPDGSPPTQVCFDVIHRQLCRKSCLAKGWLKRRAWPISPLLCTCFWPTLVCVQRNLPKLSFSCLTQNLF